MNGIARGYRNDSPLAALTLAIITHIILSITRTPIMGKPMMMKHNGIVSVM